MDPHKVHVVAAIAAAVAYGIWRRYYATIQVNNYATIQVDRLSEIPVELLSHILSYMSLRDVARMSMVSRKWRSLCLHIPSLDLDWWVLSGKPEDFTHNSTCEQRRYTRSYVRHVDRVLHNYRDQKTFKSFRLVCCLKYYKYEKEIDRWINFAAANKGTLQSLILGFKCIDDDSRVGLNYFGRKLFSMSGSFLSQFSYLQDLHLDSCIVRLRYSKLILSHNLTTLDLVNVFLAGGGPTQWQDMLTACSSTIECLRLKLCFLPKKLCIGNNFHRLRLLVIGLCEYLQEIELGAGNLEKFEFYDEEKPVKYTFISVSNLESVHMYLKCGAEYTLESLAVGTNPKYMSLRGEYPLMSKLPASPHKLFSSVLKLRISWENDDGSIVPALPCLIQSFPLLEILEIEFAKKTDTQSMEIPALHVHNNLKEIRLLGFKLLCIPVAVYLLESASVLDRMLFTKSFTEGGGMQPWERIHIIPFTDSERQSILNSLRGKASSTNVRFIFTSNTTTAPVQLHAHRFKF